MLATIHFPLQSEWRLQSVAFQSVGAVTVGVTVGAVTVGEQRGDGGCRDSG